MASTDPEVAYAEIALAALERFPKKQRKQIIEKVFRLLADPIPPGSKKLDGISHQGMPVRRIRQGDYRILYITGDLGILVLDIDHRKDVYR